MQIVSAIAIFFGVAVGSIVGHIITCGFHLLIFSLKEKERRDEFRKILEKREKEIRPD